MEDARTLHSRTQWQSLSPVRSNGSSSGSHSNRYPSSPSSHGNPYLSSPGSHSNHYLSSPGCHSNPHCSPASSIAERAGYESGSSQASSVSRGNRGGYYSSPSSILSNHSETARHNNDMYLETKTSMLEIIEEGLHLKLEIQNIKDQFISLIDDFDKFEQIDSNMKMPVSPVAVATKKPVSAARARVRALYENRKARIMAKRVANGDFTANPKQSKIPCHDLDKENCYSSLSVVTKAVPKRVTKEKPSATVTKATATKMYLTPIEEGKLGQFTSRCINNNVVYPSPLSPVSSGATPSRTPHSATPRCTTPRSVAPRRNLEGDYVTLKSPEGLRAKSRVVPHKGEIACNGNDTSVWMESPPRRPPRDLTCDRSMDYNGSPSGNPTNHKLASASPGRLSSGDISPIAKQESPKFASSDAISELYTSKNLKDISVISSQRNMTLREQVSSANLHGNGMDGALHSTFNYPLHSTMNYPLHSTLNFFDDGSKAKESKPANEQCPPEDRTAPESSSSGGLRPPLEPKAHESSTAGGSFPPRTLDPSAVIRAQSRSKPVTKSTQIKNYVNINGQAYTEADFKTPTKKPQATLCKEHGLHPTFGGPCIFQDDDMTLVDSSPEEDSVRLSPSVTDGENRYSDRVPYPGTDLRQLYADTERLPYTETESRRPYIDTDCDSSYLSECVDDVPFSQLEDYRAKDYTATYDTRKARMRMLKRQTGQTELANDQKQIRYPIGLSESDLNFDLTQKHLSLEATRASLPDLSGLSTFASEEESESTINAGQSSHNETLDSVPVQDGHRSEASSGVRPLSIATTDESPESGTGLEVPVNSPNITDSGGSSSRPTTDTYDYVDLPRNDAKEFKVPTLPPPKPRRRPKTTSDSKSLRSLRSYRSGKSTRSSRSHHALGAKDWDSGVSTNSCQWHRIGGHIDIVDTAGTKRTVVQHGSVSRNLQPDRKKQLVKRLKQFNSNLNNASSAHNLHIRTLGHF